MTHKYPNINGFLSQLTERKNLFLAKIKCEPIFFPGSLAVFASQSEATISSFSLAANSFNCLLQT
jgi:hypothetical protein